MDRLDLVPREGGEGDQPVVPGCDPRFAVIADKWTQHQLAAGEAGFRAVEVIDQADDPVARLLASVLGGHGIDMFMEEAAIAVGSHFQIPCCDRKDGQPQIAAEMFEPGFNRSGEMRSGGTKVGGCKGPPFVRRYAISAFGPHQRGNEESFVLQGMIEQGLRHIVGQEPIDDCIFGDGKSVHRALPARSFPLGERCKRKRQRCRMPVAVLSALVRPLVEPHLPPSIEAKFFTSVEELLELAPQAEIGWFDLDNKAMMVEAVKRAGKLKWFSSIYAGLDFLPHELMMERGITVTNGVGINAITIAEYVIMGMLVHAKGYREVVRAQDRHEWLLDSPGKIELAGSKALLLGYGAIGQLIKPRLESFDVAVTVVRRSGGEGVLTPDQWRAGLGDFDWIILAVPATAETSGMIGAAELAAMKPSAVLVNIARGEVVDQPALVAALQAKAIGGAFLDVTTPEPLPADDPLWSLDNAHVTMHLSGRAQTKMFQRSAERFVANCHRYVADQAVEPRFDLRLGY